MKWIRRLPEAPVTAGLIVVNLLVYAAMALSSGQLGVFSGRTLIDAGAVVAQPGVWVTHWRWVTACFIHVHALHMAMNLWALALIGVLSEKAIGRGFYAAAYLITGVAGYALSTLIAEVRQQELLSAGASGAIMGLFGLAMVFAWLTGQRAIAKALGTNVLFVLVVGFAVTVRGVVAIDNGAHLGGLLVGAVLGAVRARVQWQAPRWLGGLLIAAAAVVTAVAFAIVHAYGGAH